MVIVREIFLLFLLLVIPLVSATNNLQSHNASQIYPDNFTSGNYVFPDNVTVMDKLVLKFGEYIDNLVDGIITITGNVDLGDHNITTTGSGQFS